LVTDGDGSVYISGMFSRTVDLDPGTGEDWHEAQGYNDCFLSKIDSSGTFQWAKTWGSTDYGSYSFEVGYDLVLDVYGDIIVTGSFNGDTDFDPGPGEDIHPGNEYCTFISKFNTSGEFKWARTWSTGYNNWFHIATDGSGNILVDAQFRGSTDFDPGPGEVWMTASSQIGVDWFLSKFNSSGDFQWVRTWDYNAGIRDIISDSIGNVYLCGGLGQGTSDFDPGLGIDNHTPSGDLDSFLMKLPPDGNW
jgi:hypothetical protein